jgi:hypothetical protein
MKKSYIIILILSTIFSYHYQTVRVDYDNSSSWFLGFNVGGTWNTTDVKNRTDVGWGVILGKSYKPDVDYIDGSSSILVGYYVEELGVEVKYDLEVPIDAIYLLAHYGKHHHYKFTKNSIVLDPWRKYKNDNIEVIHYGNTRIKKAT